MNSLEKQTVWDRTCQFPGYALGFLLASDSGATESHVLLFRKRWGRSERLGGSFLIHLHYIAFFFKVTLIQYHFQSPSNTHLLYYCTKAVTIKYHRLKSHLNNRNVFSQSAWGQFKMKPDLGSPEASVLHRSVLLPYHSSVHIL